MVVTTEDKTVAAGGAAAAHFHQDQNHTLQYIDPSWSALLAVSAAILLRWLVPPARTCPKP